MKLLKKVKITGRRQALFMLAVVLGLAFTGAGAIAYYSSPPTLRNLSENSALLGASATPAQLKKTAISQQAPAADLGNSGGSGSADTKTPSPKTSALSPTTACAKFETQQQAAYNKELEKEKSKLDSILSFPMGIPNGAPQVEDFNMAALALFNKYAAQAAAADCQSLIKQPARLPLTYQP